MNESIRAFIAIAVPREIREHIVSFQHDWRSGLRGNFIRWTPEEQLHLTLRFLGKVPVEVMPELEAALRHACAGVTPFELQATGSGCFPSAHKPRVLWVGVGGAGEALTGLQAKVNRETQAWGEAEGREFHAHLTIGRVKPAPPTALRELSRRAETMSCDELGRWRVGEVLLMRSELSPAGAKHSELARVALAG